MSSALAFWLAAEAAPTFAALQLDEAGLARLARQRLAQVLRSAERTAFYHDRLRWIGLSPRDAVRLLDPAEVLAALAPVSKGELRDAGRDALVGGRVRPTWHSSRSSGSTGEPFRVHYDARAWAILKYLVKLRTRWACGVRLSDRIAVLDAVPPGSGLDAGRVRTISVLQSANAVAADLDRVRPTVLYGLPSAILEAAEALGARAGRLGVRRIFTGGELLQPLVRRALASAFAAPVHDIYGTSETKELAWECAAGSYHVNADVAHLEVVGEWGEPLPAGVEGDLIATLLVNHAMPLLRYRTGDRGILVPGRCTCGSALPRLGVVVGREVEMLALAGGRRISPYVLTCALEQVPALLRYQVVQLDPARVRVRAIVEPGVARGSIVTQVRAALQGAVAPFLQADVEFVDQLPRGPRAKFRVVEPLRGGIGGGHQPSRLPVNAPDSST